MRIAALSAQGALAGSPYPATFRHTIRCYVDSNAGTLTVDASLMSGLEVGVNASLNVPRDSGYYLVSKGCWEVLGSLVGF